VEDSVTDSASGRNDMGEHPSQGTSLIPFRWKTLVPVVPYLGAASLMLAAGCAGKAPPVNVGSLGLSLVDGGATASQPNPCEIDVEFPNDAVGRQEAATLRIANGGTTPVTFSALSPSLDPAFAADLENLTAPLQPLSFVDVELTFDPVGDGPVSSTFSIGTSLSSSLSSSLSGGACSSLVVSLTGTGEAADLAVDPASLDLGNALLGTSVQKTVTLANQAAGRLSGLTASISGSGAADFTLSGVPSWLDAGSSAEVGVLFQPQSQVARSSATVTFMGSVGQSATLSLSGEPLASALTLTPNPIDFGYVVPAESEVACTTATNISNVPVTITGLGSFVPPVGGFSTSGVDDAVPPNPAPVPVTLQPDAGAKVCFTLTPSVPNQYTGQVTLQTSPTETNPVLQLTGFGGGPR